MGAREEVIFAAESDVAQLLLGEIVVETQASVIDETGQGIPVVENVACGLSKIRARRFALMGEHQPSLELLEHRGRTLLSKVPCVDPIDIQRKPWHQLCLPNHLTAAPRKGDRNREGSSQFLIL